MPQAFLRDRCCLYFDRRCLCVFFLGEWAFSKAGFTIFVMNGEDKLHSLEIKQALFTRLHYLCQKY